MDRELIDFGWLGWWLGYRRLELRLMWQLLLLGRAGKPLDRFEPEWI